MSQNRFSRRDFLKGLTLASASLCSAAGLESCTYAGKTSREETPGAMTYRANPRNQDRISLLGYGCMRFQMKEENGVEVIDQESVNELIDLAIKQGINYFDTAPVYLQGQSEQAVGKALSRYPRENYFLATKLSSHRHAYFSGGMSPGQMFDASIRLYKGSLEALQTSYLDYYLLHNIASIETFQSRFTESGVLEYMKNEKAEGRIRNLGVSVHCDKETFDFVLGQYDWDFVQIQMNYYDWKHGALDLGAEYMYEELERRGIPVAIMEPIQGGRLADVDYAALNELRASEPGSTAASWAFRFCASFPGVMTVLSGMTYMEHLRENLSTFSPLKPLSREQTEKLLEMADLMAERPLIQCNACQYCMPCPYGLDIPSILTHYNKCLKEGNIIEDPTDSQYKKARKAFLLGYDRSVPKLRQAAHCAGCRECVPHCPQHIDIPEQMQRIDQYVESLKRYGTRL